MRYLILKPREGTFDPRSTKFDSSAALHDAIPPLVECSTEAEAAKYARGMFPDAVTVPMPVQVGSGTTVLLGFIDDVRAREQVNPDRPIPFVLMVQAVAQHDVDRRILKQVRPPFNESAWKLQPISPQLYHSELVEVRSHSARAPLFTTARVGTHNGKLVLYVEAEGEAFSILFSNPNVQLRREIESEPSATVADGEPDREPSV